MSIVGVQSDSRLTGAGEVMTNDFAIVAATVNGSGSQTANTVLIRALFKMGIPVNGKNLFPSNIAGLPTWYTIRVSKDGYVARRDDYHVLVAMNKNTQAEDMRNLAPGGICIYPEEWKCKVLLEGNSAVALGSIFGGVTVAAWYPITPSTSVIDALKDYANELRVDPNTGESTCAIIQAEDELAAIGMVVGAGWAGARAMTATAGPGISLMSEFAGLAYFAEIPSVIWDIQRMGPSTGLPTRVSQGDVLKAYFLSHGDTKQVVLLPGDMAECFEFGWTAFDIAEHLQTLVLVLSDLDLGMNLWMTEPFQYPEKPFDRGKVLNADDIARLNGFARYRDDDNDGIGPRTLPGTDHPLAAYFARGTGHNEFAQYSERPDDWENNLKRLQRKHDTARKPLAP